MRRVGVVQPPPTHTHGGSAAAHRQLTTTARAARAPSPTCTLAGQCPQHHHATAMHRHHHLATAKDRGRAATSTRALHTTSSAAAAGGGGGGGGGGPAPHDGPPATLDAKIAACGVDTAMAMAVWREHMGRHDGGAHYTTLPSEAAVHQYIHTLCMASPEPLRGEAKAMLSSIVFTKVRGGSGG